MSDFFANLPAVLPITPFPSAKTWGGEPLWAAVPGSKSITNRALLLAALDPRAGAHVLTGALASRDTVLMRKALEVLGFSIAEKGDTLCLKKPADGVRREVDLFVGNAGTVARFLTAFLAVQPDAVYHMDGDEEMRLRPMAGLIEALKQGGTVFEFSKKENCFPFTMRTFGMREIPACLEVDAAASSQILSALLMIGPFCPQGTTLKLKGGTVSRPFVEMTCEMMRQWWGPDAVRESGGVFSFGVPPAGGDTRPYAIEPDATAASYFLSLPIAAPVCAGVGGICAAMLQGDIAYTGALRKAGVTVSFTEKGGLAARAAGEKLRGVEENFNAFSDTFLTLAALAPLLKDKTVLTGLAHTRHQETDRLNAMATELRKLGQKVEETDDTIVITPDRAALARLSKDAPVAIATYKDHRMAMSFGILGCHDLHGDGRAWIAIEDPACCAKTFPYFFDVLEHMRQQATFPVVAIDGGAASGKSSTARGLSERLNLMHVDTGSHYRALTYALLEAGVSPDDVRGIEAALGRLKVSSVVEGRSSRVALNGTVPEDACLRTESVNANVSKFAAVPQVRAFLKDYQRGQKDVACERGFAGLVMEGRDIGSVIFPDAPLRFFLEADQAVRAARRAAEGQTDAVADRDRMDATRKTAPLTCPEGAERIDNSRMTLEEVVAHLASRVKTWRDR